MRIEARTLEPATVLSSFGRLDGARAPALEAPLKAVAEGGGSPVPDCTDMDYVSSAGLRVMLIRARTSRQDGEARRALASRTGSLR